MASWPTRSGARRGRWHAWVALVLALCWLAVARSDLAAEFCTATEPDAVEACDGVEESPADEDPGRAHVAIAGAAGVCGEPRHPWLVSHRAWESPSALAALVAEGCGQRAVGSRAPPARS